MKMTQYFVRKQALLTLAVELYDALKLFNIEENEITDEEFDDILLSVEVNEDNLSEFPYFVCISVFLNFSMSSDLTEIEKMMEIVKDAIEGRETFMNQEIVDAYEKVKSLF